MLVANANVQNTLRIYAIRAYSNSSSIIWFEFSGMIDCFIWKTKAFEFRDKYIQKSNRFFVRLHENGEHSENETLSSYRMCNESLTFTLHLKEELWRRDYFKVNEMHCIGAPTDKTENPWRSQNINKVWVRRSRNRKF